MEEQIPPSQFPGQPTGQDYFMNEISPENLAAMKARAKEQAIRQAARESLAQLQQQPPQVMYVRRNLTVAELLVVFLISCGIVTGIQFVWHGVSNLLPRIEVRVK
jgi:hypothetical protein